MSRVQWAARAIADLHAIEAYLARFGEDIAKSEVEQLIRAARWLGTVPYAGPTVDIDDWRRWKSRGTRHLLLYRPTADGIDVLRVPHERNDWRGVQA